MRVLATLIVLSVAAAVGPAGHAAAHALGAAPTRLAWPWQPWVLLALGVTATWYVAGLLHIRRRDGLARAIGTSQTTSFAVGVLVLFLALASPLDTLGDELFSAHMVQHLLLLLVAPPLLVYGRPGIAMLWALAPKPRRAVGRLWAAAGLGRGVQWLMHPVLVWLLFCGSFAFWHLPGPYQWAVGNEVVHAIEHLSFLVTALMFWTLVIEPSGRRRVGYGGTLLLVSTAAVLSSLPGALLFLAPRPLYAVHAAGVAAWGLSLIEDQQIAGVIMWIPAGLVYLGAIEWVFLRWLRDAERRAAPVLRRTVLLAAAALALAVVSGAPALAQTPAMDPVPSVGGDAGHGAALIRLYGCGACHVVPGIAGADGVVGPPLTMMGRRIYLAGLLRNTPDNMITWLRAPQRVVPGNAMPDMGINAKDARDITAYLYTLR